MESEERTAVPEDEAQADESQKETDRDVRLGTADIAARADEDREPEDEARGPRQAQT
jgi:hypothetical protein